MLASHDFATAESAPADLAAMIAAAEVEFAAIGNWLPAYLAGRTAAQPDTTQLAQTLAFAARVGWVDPGADAATPQARFESAVGYLCANRMLQSALLPTGFEGDTDPFAFPNEAGIALTVEFGRESGVVTDAWRRRRRGSPRPRWRASRTTVPCGPASRAAVTCCSGSSGRSSRRSGPTRAGPCRRYRPRWCDWCPRRMGS